MQAADWRKQKLDAYASMDGPLQAPAHRSIIAHRYTTIIQVDIDGDSHGGWQNGIQFPPSRAS